MPRQYDSAPMRARMQQVLQERWQGSRRAWAAASAVSDTTLGKILRGESGSPELETLVALAQTSGITVSQLIGEVPLVPPTPPALPPDEELARITAETRRTIAGLSADMEGVVDELSRVLRTLQSRE